jgi:hypothetical protein
MVAWRESRQDEWRFERLRLLFERLHEAVRPTGPRRLDSEPKRKRRHAPRTR